MLPLLLRNNARATAAFFLSTISPKMRTAPEKVFRGRFSFRLIRFSD
jgi:hypothetical protein